MGAKELIQKKQENKQISATSNMNMLLQSMAGAIKKALPAQINSERFQRVALTAFSSNQKLQQCDPISFLAAMMQSAQLGLEPNTPLGQAYLIPYGKQVQFQVGYKGLLELAQRSGQFKSIYSHEVRENDEFEMEYGLNQKLVHKPNLKQERGEVIGYYACYHLTNGGESMFFMTKDEIINFAKSKSKTFNNGPWQTDFEAMAKKTVLKQLLKYAPLSIESQKFMSMDETVKSDISANMDEINNDTVEFEVDIQTGEVITDNVVENTNEDEAN